MQGGYWGGFAAMLFFWLIFNCLICCNWKKVQIAIAIIDTAADFMVATKRLCFISLIYFVVAIVYFGFWLAACVGVVALNDISVNPEVFQGKTI